MSTLLALVLVTQAEHTSPTLTFAWPPQPRPIPRLDRPVYKPAQTRAGGADPLAFTKPQSRSQSCLPKEDPAVLHYVRGFKKDGGSSEDEVDLFYEPSAQPPLNRNPASQRVASGGSLTGSFIRRKGTLVNEGTATPADQDDDSNTCPGSFYWASVNDLPRKDRTSEPLDTDQYLGFQRDAWADMLIAKSSGPIKKLEGNNRGAGSGRKLELVIDALAIIGHPSVISQKSMISQIDATFERGRTRTRSGENDVQERNQSTASDSFVDRNLTLASAENIRNNSSLREANQSKDPSTVAHTSNTPASSHIISSDAKPHGITPSLLDPATTPLPMLSPSPSRPAAPVSQLTRMMTPSRSTHLDSPPISSIYNLASTSSVRSASSPSPTPLQRVTYQPFLGSHLPPTRSIFGYSPLDSVRSITTPAPDSVDDRMSTSTRLVPLQSFTLALIIDTPPASHLSQHLEVYYQDVVLKLTAALKRLERQSSYLTRESQKISALQLDRRESDSLRSTSKGTKISTEAMMRLIERQSDLAKALAQIFDDLKDLGRTSVTFDDQLDLELLLHRELFDDPTGSDHCLKSNQFVSEAGEQDRYTHLESWKSLLLLEDPQVLIELAPPQSLLRDFIAIIKSDLTLSEYKILLDTDSSTIAEMTEHLIYWRKAKLIDVVTHRNTYQLAPLAAAGLSATLQPDLIGDQELPTMLSISALSENFSIDFPKLPPLVSILSLISKRARQPFSSILPAPDPRPEKSNYIPVLVWLLKHNLICRERTHVRLKVDARTKIKVKQMDRYQHKRSDEEIAEHEDLGSLSPEFEIRVQPGEVSTSPATRQISSIRPPMPPTRVSSQRIPSPLINTIGTRSVYTLPRHHSDQSHIPIPNLPASATRSTSDYSASNLSNQPSHRLEPGSIDSLPSSNELSRRRRRRMRQLSVQSGCSYQSEENGRVEELDDGECDEEDEILGEPGKATPLQRRWLDELCDEKPEALVTTFNLALRYFNGRYPLEEIISRCGLARKALNDVLTEFDSNLILLIHP